MKQLQVTAILITMWKHLVSFHCKLFASGAQTSLDFAISFKTD